MLRRRVRPEEWLPVGIGELEAGAWRVIRSTSYCSVVAGPGAGKTELLAQRAAYLLETGNCPYPRRILAISFKKDAASNLKKRIVQRCKQDDARRFDSLTFDAFSKGLLDRFHAALPENWRPGENYEILFPNRDMYNDFFRTLADRIDDPDAKRAILSLNADNFERDYIVSHPLPAQWTDRSSFGAWAAGRWWNEQINLLRPSRISFPMIGRLVEMLLRANPHIKKALRATYSHVFMDEFQDTTNVQYDLVKEAFLGSSVILTAVGDHKQRIMGWANALPHAFVDFERDFAAAREELRWNHRSSPALVAIQNCFARVLDPDAEEVESRVGANVEGEACAVWEYQSPESEAAGLADFIRREIHIQQLAPRDFVLLVRQRAADYERVILPVFENRGIRLRNEDREVGRVRLQDLLTEAASQQVINFLRLASCRRGGVHWQACIESVADLRGIHVDDDQGRVRVSGEVTTFLQELSDNMRALPQTLADARHLVNMIIDFLDRDQLRMTSPEYRQGTRFNDVIDAIARHIFSCTEQAETWTPALDAYEGIGSVPLMTIHKSKGLEFHTVIFIGLDDAAWWSFRRDRYESLAGFFVSFTRAAQRAFYTYCPTRGTRRNIDEIYQLFYSCDVPILRHNN